MKEEIFDVVNARNEVVARRSRRLVHRLGLRHRAVHVLVFDSRGRVFLQKRSRHKDTHPGVWDSSASGHLDSGEDYPEAAARELREELGLTAPLTLTLLFHLGACEETGAEFVQAYRAASDGPFRLQPEEIERGDWFSAEEVSRRVENYPADFAPSFVLIWKTWRAMAAERSGSKQGRRRAG